MRNQPPTISIFNDQSWPLDVLFVEFKCGCYDGLQQDVEKNIIILLEFNILHQQQVESAQRSFIPKLWITCYWIIQFEVIWIWSSFPHLLTMGSIVNTSNVDLSLGKSAYRRCTGVLHITTGMSHSWLVDGASKVLAWDEKKNYTKRNTNTPSKTYTKW